MVVHSSVRWMEKSLCVGTGDCRLIQRLGCSVRCSRVLQPGPMNFQRVIYYLQRAAVISIMREPGERILLSLHSCIASWASGGSDAGANWSLVLTATAPGTSELARPTSPREQPQESAPAGVRDRWVRRRFLLAR